MKESRRAASQTEASGSKPPVQSESLPSEADGVSQPMQSMNRPDQDGQVPSASA